MRRLASVLAALAVTYLAIDARADCGKTSTGVPRLCRNTEAVDVYQGPVLAPLRATALAGAYAAIADNIDALGQNAAAVTVRSPYSTSWFDYDVTASISLRGVFGDTDFDNSGRAGLAGTAFFYTFGGLVQLGPLGVGVLSDFQQFHLSQDAGSTAPASTVTVGRIHAVAGYTLLGDQLSVGGGVRGLVTSLNTVRPGEGLTLHGALVLSGAAPEVGLLFKPDYQPYRLGITYRGPVETNGGDEGAADADGVRRQAGLALPRTLRQPWEVELAVALSAGPRPLNPTWIDPHAEEAEARRRVDGERRQRRSAQRAELEAIADLDERQARERDFEAQEPYVRAEEERHYDRLVAELKSQRKARYANWPRDKILVVAELLVTGPSTDAVSLQSFMRQEDVRSGARTTVQPRLGVEGEPIRNRLEVRMGTYLEPTRYDVQNRDASVVAGARQHFTFGVECRTVHWDVFGIAAPTDFSINFAGDFAPRYENLGIGISTWHLALGSKPSRRGRGRRRSGGGGRRSARRGIRRGRAPRGARPRSCGPGSRARSRSGPAAPPARRRRVPSPPRAATL